jgi:hypothetical protein
MNWKLIVLSCLALIGLAAFGLALTNPTAIDYRQAVLVPLAQQEANRLAAEERRLLDRELASLQAHLLAINYEGNQLDVARLRRQYPLLGPSFASSDDPGRATLHERLGQSREKILKRIETTREAMYYSHLVTLAHQTARTSYGLWSEFVTCTKRSPVAYIGLAGRFNPRPPSSCSTVRLR